MAIIIGLGLLFYYFWGLGMQERLGWDSKVLAGLQRVVSVHFFEEVEYSTFAVEASHPKYHVNPLPPLMVNIGHAVFVNVFNVGLEASC